MSESENRMLLSQGLELAASIEAGMDGLFEKRSPSDHTLSNWASEIHHPCLLHLVYCRTRWRERQMMDLDGEYRTETGKKEEKDLLRKIELAGYDVEDQQARFESPELHLVCKVDAMLRVDREKYPIEAKTVNPNYWDQLRTIEDVKTSRRWWLNKITSQLNCEIYLSKKEMGFLGLVTFGKRPRILPMVRDPQLWSLDSMKAGKVNEHVERGTFPEPMPYDAQVCGMCDFNHVCPVVKELPETWIAVSREETIKLNWYLDLKKQRDSFNELHAELVGNQEKPGVYFGKNALEGDIEISSTTQRRKKVKVPKEIRDKFSEDYDLTITTIDRRSSE
jgi:hypothetical protein